MTMLLMDVINYCCNPEKVRSSLVGGVAVNPLYAVYEMETLAALCNKSDGLRLRHMVLSFDPLELQDAYIAFQIAYRAALYYGANYQIIFCVHEDTEHVNVHFVMNSVSYTTGLKYHGTRKDYYDFLNHLGNELDKYGFILTVY